MSARLGALRWMSSDAVSACWEVKDLAPALSNLLCDPVVPERPLNQLLDWAEIAADPELMAAFELLALRDALPAIVTAFIASHSYRLERDADEGRESDRLVLHDTGNGAVVGRIMMLITEVIAPVHGDEGRDLAREFEGRSRAKPAAHHRDDRRSVIFGGAADAGAASDPASAFSPIDFRPVS